MGSGYFSKLVHGWGIIRILWTIFLKKLKNLWRAQKRVKKMKRQEKI
jgi:hypothetical protein